MNFLFDRLLLRSPLNARNSEKNTGKDKVHSVAIGSSSDTGGKEKLVFSFTKRKVI